MIESGFELTSTTVIQVDGTLWRHFSRGKPRHAHCFVPLAESAALIALCAARIPRFDRRFFVGQTIFHLRGQRRKSDHNCMQLKSIPLARIPHHEMPEERSDFRVNSSGSSERGKNQRRCKVGHRAHTGVNRGGFRSAECGNGSSHLFESAAPKTPSRCHRHWPFDKRQDFQPHFECYLSAQNEPQIGPLRCPE